jgi:uncharacterized protein YndB with AHSA1/START domain
MSEFKRARVEFNAEIAASAGDVWDLLADWGGMLRWWPASAPVVISKVELTGEPGVLPVTRVLTMQDGAQGVETLLKADPVARRLYYSVQDGGIPGARNYVATNTVDALGAGRCALTFSSSFDVAEQDEEMAKAIILAIYGFIGDGFRQYFEAPKAG